MKADPQSSKDHRNRPEVHELLTARERRRFSRLQQKMTDCADCLGYLCDRLVLIKDAIMKADEAAEALLDDDALEALATIKRLQQAAKRKAGVKEDWEVDVA